MEIHAGIRGRERRLYAFRQSLFHPRYIVIVKHMRGHQTACAELIDTIDTTAKLSAFAVCNPACTPQRRWKGHNVTPVHLLENIRDAEAKLTVLPLCLTIAYRTPSQHIRTADTIGAYF